MEKKEIQKQRMMRYFIDATRRIIDTEGFEGVTVRRIADYAGYNSATLYNYFDNLQHLLFFYSMSYLKEYVESLPKFLEGSRDSREKYLRIWRCFCHFSFHNPRVYETIFFNNGSYSIKEAAEQYYSIFPEEIAAHPEFLTKMLLRSDIYSRNITLLESVKDEGFISEESVGEINDMTLLIYQGMLMQVINNDGLSVKSAIDKTVLYIEKTLDAFRL
ncbi:TetR/AcrR family transcriptional regulator [Alkaliphilus serpentinus]|uniref:TetR/AcrR family transcriptional regulator n=1 Tax=Alkaliphilus serpentinus TaxID=1482731 RepID=A0A833HNW1_9FIRM|nr:TetR/AcrR family transcriptional regulator [Alkaliphilus serpentinus]KAB3529995.1 TetR/AcrR family transcriptional regulator [Alkaliphilus serpentinus]